MFLMIMDVINKDILDFWPFYIYFLINYFLIKRKACNSFKSKILADFEVHPSRHRCRRV